MIDLRSDTVTQPTEEMRRAMYKAEVGDDFYGSDPTVLKLEEISATMLGKEAALFMPSGTMANSAALLTHTHRGDSMILEENAHVYRCETGHLAVIAGVLPKRIKGHKGLLAPDEIEAALFGEGVLYATTRLIWLENTHNGAGGTCVSAKLMCQTRRVADKHGLAIHVDGERIFNAAIALGVDVKDLARDADSLQFGLSKGLACPYGSVLVGSKDFIVKARKYRQMLGGGMRQAGIMAAAGIVGLQKMIDRLKEDHANAKTLAKGLVELGMIVDVETVQTNIVYFSVPPTRIKASYLVAKLTDCGVITNPPSKDSNRVRMVTHYGITQQDIKEALNAFKTVLE